MLKSCSCLKPGLICLVLLLTSLFYVPGIAQVQVRNNISVQSTILGRAMSYAVILPENYYPDRVSYPVVYLLHGFGGDHTSWINRCHIDDIIDSLQQLKMLSDFIYVLPDAENSYYINNFDSTFMYADFFTNELVPQVDASYATIPAMEKRALLGLSMGGFGSLILAIKNPHLFGNVIAMSASVRTEDMFMTLSQDRFNTYFGRVYGPGLEGEDRITLHWLENSPYYLINDTSAEVLRTINWYIDCGFEDFLFPANEVLHRQLIKYNISHNYHIRPGEHNWDYWYNSTVNGLLYLNQQINQ